MLFGPDPRTTQSAPKERVLPFLDPQKRSLSKFSNCSSVEILACMEIVFICEINIHVIKWFKESPPFDKMLCLRDFQAKFSNNC